MVEDGNNLPQDNETAEVAETNEIEDLPGFHVVKDNIHLGTYQTREDAQAFIDGHAGEGAEIVEGSN